MNSNSEENYLKTIYAISKKIGKGASTNAIAKKLETKASSVTDMVQKLADKQLLNYKKYQGASLTKKGEKLAIEIIRKHRLWEVFLLEKLNFKWDEVHEIAEQLEHIQSKELTKRLDLFLGKPKFDPHGDPIPDANGNIENQVQCILLSEAQMGKEGIIVGVRDSDPAFLRFLDSQKLALGMQIKIKNQIDYDKSKIIAVNNKELILSNRICSNIKIQLKN